MPWMQHRLRDAQVWAEVDDRGQLIADAQGRVSIVYKRDPAAKIYKAGSRNLDPLADASVVPDLGAGGAAGAPARAEADTATSTKPRAARARSAGAIGSGQLSDKPPPGTIQLWADGACTGNPGPAALGVVVIDGANRREHAEYLGMGTNNIAELTAILRGLDLVADPARPVWIYTDSQYSIGVLSLAWKPKANVDLIQTIKERLTSFTQVRFIKVPGHAGIPENERCDALARGAISRRR